MTMRKGEFLIALLLSILLIELSLCFRPLEKNLQLKVGYNVIIDREIPQEKAELLAKRLKEANCEVAKVWLPTRLLKTKVLDNGEYGGWDFSLYDRVLEPIAREGIEIILEPVFRSAGDMNIPDLREDMLVVRGGKRVPFPSLLHPRVREYILSTLEAISAHYAKTEIGEKIVAIDILNEPYIFNFGGLSILVEENHRVVPAFLMPDEKPDCNQDFYWQVEKIAEFVGMASDRIKMHLRGTKTMVVADGGFFTFPPSIALHKALWEKVDLIGIDPYVGSFAGYKNPFPWFYYKMLVEQAKQASKPIWVTEWNWDAAWWYEWTMPLDFPKEFVERSADYGVEGVCFFLFNSFGKPGLFALYDLEGDEIPPEKLEIYEAVKKAYEEIKGGEE